MAYQKPGSTRWYCAVREPGTQRRVEFSFATRQEAELHAVKYRLQKRQDPCSLMPPPGGDTFAEVATDYFRQYKARNPAGCKTELYPFNRYIMPVLGHLTLRDITADVLARLHASLPGADNTRFRRMGIVRAILGHAEGMVEGYTAPRLRLSAGRDKLIIPATEEEYRAVLRVSPPHFRRICMLGWHTGVRPGKSELLRLTWADVGRDSIRIVSAHKGGLPLREVPLSVELQAALEEWREEDDGKGHLIHYHKKPVGRIISGWWLIIKRAGVREDIRPYSLRHAFCTRLIRAGVDMATVAYLMGHASPATTMRTYRYVTGLDTTEAIRRLNTSTEHILSSERAKTEDIQTTYQQ